MNKTIFGIGLIGLSETVKHVGPRVLSKTRENTEITTVSGAKTTPKNYVQTILNAKSPEDIKPN